MYSASFSAPSSCVLIGAVLFKAYWEFTSALILITYLLTSLLSGESCGPQLSGGAVPGRGGRTRAAGSVGLPWAPCHIGRKARMGGGLIFSIRLI